MFVEGKSRTVFFLQTLLFTAFVATVQKIITYALGAHDPGSAQDGRTSNDFCTPEVWRSTAFSTAVPPLPAHSRSKKLNEFHGLVFFLWFRCFKSREKFSFFVWGEFVMGGNGSENLKIPIIGSKKSCCKLYIWLG